MSRVDPNVMRTAARIAEGKGLPICATHLRNAAEEIEQLRGSVEHLHALVADLEAAAEVADARYTAFAVNGEDV